MPKSPLAKQKYFDTLAREQKVFGSVVLSIQD
jgi:hypothetical protein